MLKQMSFKKMVGLFLGISVICLLLSLYVLAWSEPTSGPPGDNVPTPINVGTNPQAKAGRITATEFYDYNNPEWYVNPAGQSVFSGNVGIGTTNPGYKLDVVGQINSSGGLCIGGDCKANWGEVAATGYWTQSGSNLYTKDTGWNVGIGTTAPGAKLDVAGAQFDQSPASGNYWVNYYLGRNADPNPGDIILLIPNPAGTVTGSFMEGTITASRGSTGAYRSLKQWHISVSRAYTTNEGSITPLSQETAMIKLVTCDYNGQNYIAIDTSAIGASAHRWKFTGSWLNTINSQKPTLIPRASCSNIADYKTYHALGNQIAIDTSGNVGIGTTNPGYKLDVVGQINSSGGLCIAGDCKANWGEVVATGYWIQSGSNLYTKDTGWNVGIGTTAPGAKLDVQSGNVQLSGGYGLDWENDPWGGSGDDAWIKYIQDGSGEDTELQIGVSNDANDNIAFYQSGAERMTIYNGNVGIGTASPGQKLDVAGNIRVTGDWYWLPSSNFQLYASANNQEWSFDLRNTGTYTGTYWQVWSDTHSSILAVRGDTGNVGIGTTNPAEKLHVAGNLRVDGNSNTCHLVAFPDPGTCPSGYYTWDAVASGPSGYMMCCKVDNPL
ncbi:hypothetical protein DRJ00_08460 [Candidatus Aerophobetes bacterium]|uniref:Uncharacterized protein n=1 Tax=Aerophobetes bacterium TaxID=2030807 RepID=A0A497E2I0_UNCAE|nr:MAG: hypothetical protein DRJ00_08460 [Candidatus Aerophobetes bacterium]